MVKKDPGRPDLREAKANIPAAARGDVEVLSGDGPHTLTIDIGGTGIKRLPLDRHGSVAGAHVREPTPQPAEPASVLAAIEALLVDAPAVERVSVGFPGVVVRGVTKTAPNLNDPAWRDFDLRAAVETLTSRPTRVINDADLQGYGVIRGRGTELVLTLGTGLGSGLYSDGHLVANLELAHHPYGDGTSYEERVSDAELARIGVASFKTRVQEMIAQIAPILNYERLYLGGGNARFFEQGELPAGVELFDNVGGMRGGVRLWHDHLIAG